MLGTKSGGIRANGLVPAYSVAEWYEFTDTLPRYARARGGTLLTGQHLVCYCPTFDWNRRVSWPILPQ
jgi:hypothetical protein